MKIIRRFLIADLGLVALLGSGREVVLPHRVAV